MRNNYGTAREQWEAVQEDSQGEGRNVMSLGDEYKDEIVYGSFYQVEVPGEGKFNYPTADYTPEELMAMFEIDEVHEVTGYFIELLDDETQELIWHGPFDSEEEIEDHLDNLYG